MVVDFMGILSTNLKKLTFYHKIKNSPNSRAIKRLLKGYDLRDNLHAHPVPVTEGVLDDNVRVGCA